MMSHAARTKKNPNANEQLGVHVTDNWLLPDEGLGGNGIVQCAVCRRDSERADRFNGEAEDSRVPGILLRGLVIRLLWRPRVARRWYRL